MHSFSRFTKAAPYILSTTALSLGSYWLGTQKQRVPSSYDELTAVIKKLPPHFLESAIVKSFITLNPGMSGHTIADQDPKALLKTVQVSHYTRLAGGAWGPGLAKNSQGELCVILVKNIRRKIPTLECPQGYANPPHLAPIKGSVTQLHADYQTNTDAVEHLPKSLIDRSFERQLRGASLTEELMKAKQEQSAFEPVREHFHPTTTDTMRDEFEEEAGISSKNACFLPTTGCHEYVVQSWGLSVKEQGFCVALLQEDNLPLTLENLRTVNEDEPKPVDVEEIESVHIIPLQEIHVEADGSGRYKEHFINEREILRLREALKTFFDKDLSHATDGFFQDLNTASAQLKKDPFADSTKLFDFETYLMIREAAPTLSKITQNQVQNLMARTASTFYLPKTENTKEANSPCPVNE